MAQFYVKIYELIQFDSIHENPRNDLLYFSWNYFKFLI